MESEDLFHNLFLQHTAVMLLIDPENGRIIDANDAASRFCGWAHETLMTMRISDINTLPGARVAEAMQKAREKKTIYFEFSHRLADGSVREVEVYTSAIEIKGRELLHLIIHDISEREIIEGNLETGAREWSTTFDSIQDAVWLLDKDYRVVRANRASVLFTGIELSDLIGRKCWEIVHGSDGPAACCPAARLWASHRPESSEFFIMDKWMQITVFPIFGASGELSGAVHIMRNITDSKNIEFTLRESESALQKAQHVAHLGSWTWKIKENRVVWSEEMFRIFGIDKDSFTGNLTDVIARAIHPEDRVAVEKSNKMVLEEGRPTPLEYRVLRSDGTVRWIYAEAGDLVLDDLGCPKELSGIAQDITDRKEHEKALIESEAKYRRLVDTMNDAYVVTDMEGFLIEYNSQYQELLGYSEDELRKLNYVDITPSKWHAIEAEKVEKQILPLGYSDVYEKEYIRKDGSIIPVELRTYLIRDYKGKPQSMWAIVRDITERKRKENELRRALAEITLKNKVANVLLTMRGDDMFNEVLNLVLESIDSPMGYFGYINDRGDLVSPSLTRDVWDMCRMDDKSITFPRNEWRGLWGRSLAERKTMVSNCELTTPEGHIKLTRALAVPIMHGGDLIGQIVVANKAIDYLDEDTSLMENIANYIAPLLHNYLILEKQKTSQEKFEQELRASEERLRIITDNMFDMVSMVDLKGNYLYVSPAHTKILGYSTEEMYGKSIHDFLYPEDTERISELIANASNECISGKAEFPYRHRDGSYRWIEIIGKLITDATGSPVSIILSGRDITVRKKIEDALKESEAKYRELMENANSAIIRWKRDGAITFFNEYAQRLFGWDAAEIMGKHINIIVPEKESTGGDLSSLVEDIVMDPYKFQMNINENICKDGRRVWMAWTNKPVMLNDSQVDEILCIGTDITDRVLKEKALEKSKASLSVAQRVAHVGSWTWDIRQDSLEWSDEMFNIFGIDKNSFAGNLTTAHESSIHPADRDRVVKANRRILIKEEKITDPLQYRIIKPDGTVRTVLGEAGSLVLDENGNPLQLSGIVMDVTERAKETALLKILIDLGSYAVTHALDDLLRLTLDKAEELTDSSIGFLHFLEKDQRTLTLQMWSTNTIAHMCTAEGKGNHYDIEKAGVWVDAARIKRPVIHNDYKSLPHKKGLPPGHAPVTRELVVPVMRDEIIMAVIGVGNKKSPYNENDIQTLALLGDRIWDIIARSRAEDKLRILNARQEQLIKERTADLEKANRELESFSYTVSHDLRAPLRHINGFLEMFRRETGKSLTGKTAHYMDVINDSAKRMGNLIDDLLAFSRMGRTSLSVSRINMQKLFDDIISEYSEEIQARHISIEKENLLPVDGDASMLRVALGNLFSNAVKFTSKTKNTVIEVGSNVEKNEIIFYIRDNGAGFDMKYVDKLFGVFQRLHSERDFEGTGIGLATVKSIIQRHGGRVWAEGEPGRGSCFYFTLPIVAIVNNS